MKSLRTECMLRPPSAHDFRQPLSLPYCRPARDESAQEPHPAFGHARKLNKDADKIWAEMEKAGLPAPEYRIREDGHCARPLSEAALNKRRAAFCQKIRLRGVLAVANISTTWGNTCYQFRRKLQKRL